MDDTKETKPKPQQIPPPPPPLDPPYNITRVHEAGDGAAVVTVNPDPNWLTGFVVVISALQQPGFIQLQYPYKVIRIDPNGGTSCEYNLQEEDEDGALCIPWNGGVLGNGPNQGTIALR